MAKAHDYLIYECWDFQHAISWQKWLRVLCGGEVRIESCDKLSDGLPGWLVVVSQPGDVRGKGFGDGA